MTHFLILKFLIAVIIAHFVEAKNLQPYYKRSKSIENYVTERKVTSDPELLSKNAAYTKTNRAESENLFEGNSDHRSHKKLFKRGYHHPLFYSIETSHLRKENDVYQNVKALGSTPLNISKIAFRTHGRPQMSQLDHPLSFVNKGHHPKDKKNANLKMLIQKPRFFNAVKISHENQRKGEVFEFYNRNTTEDGKARNESTMIITADPATMRYSGRMKPSKIINKRIRKVYRRHPIRHMYEGSRFENNDGPRLRRRLSIESLKPSTLDRKRVLLWRYKGFRTAYNRLPFYQRHESPQIKNFHGLKRWIRMGNVKPKLLNRKRAPLWLHKRFRKPFNRLPFSYRNERAHGLKAAQKALQMATMSPSYAEKQTQRIQETETDYMDLVFQDSATVIDTLEEIRTKNSGLIESIVNFFKSTKSTVTESEGILEENTITESKGLQKEEKMQLTLRRPRLRMHRKRDKFWSQKIYYPKTEMNTRRQFYRPISPVEIKEYKLVIAKTWNYTLPIKKKKSNLMEKANLFDVSQEFKNKFHNDLTNDWTFNDFLRNRETNTALGNLKDNSEQLQSVKTLEENSAVDLLDLYNHSAKIKVEITTSYAADSAKNVKGINEVNKKKFRIISANDWEHNEGKKDDMNVSEKHQLLKNTVAHVSNGTSCVSEYAATTLTKLPVVLSTSLSLNSKNRSGAGHNLGKVIKRSKVTDKTSTSHSRDASNNVQHFNELDQGKGRMILLENLTHISTVGSSILLESKVPHLVFNVKNLSSVGEGFDFSKYHLFQNSTELPTSIPPNISNYELTSSNKLHVLSSTRVFAAMNSYKEKLNLDTTTLYRGKTSKKVKDTYHAQSTNIRKAPLNNFKQISTTESFTESEPKYFIFVPHNKENVNNTKEKDTFSNYQQLRNTITSNNNSFTPRLDLAISQNLHAILNTPISSNDVTRKNTENLLKLNTTRGWTEMYGNSTKISDFAVTSDVRKNLTGDIKYTDDIEKKNVRGLFLHNLTDFLNENITASKPNCTLFCLHNDRETNTMNGSNHSLKFRPFRNSSDNKLNITSFTPKFQLTFSNSLLDVTMSSNVKRKIDSKQLLASSKNNNSHESVQSFVPNATLRSSPNSLIIRKKNSSEHMLPSKNVSVEISHRINNVLYRPTEIYSTKNRTSNAFLNEGFHSENNMQKTTVANDTPYMKNQNETYFTTLMEELNKTRKLKREFKMTDDDYFETSEQTERYDRPSFYENEQDLRIRKHAPMSLSKNIKYTDNQKTADKMSQNKIIPGGKSKMTRKREHVKTFQSPPHLQKNPVFINYTNDKKFSDWPNSMNEGNMYDSKESSSEGTVQHAEEQELVSAFNHDLDVSTISYQEEEMPSI